jgi:tRNA threonylcarbamoyladenosine biosynthesis protein TsaE
MLKLMEGGLLLAVMCFLTSILLLYWETMQKRLLTYRSQSPEETRAVGQSWSSGCRSGDFIALFGSLGAGKTVFVQGLAFGLGIPVDWVKSPTFTLVRAYPSDPAFYHVDLYRLEGEQTLNLDWEDFSRGVTVVEWAEKLGAPLPVDAIRVTIEVISLQERQITIEGYHNVEEGSPDRSPSDGISKVG